MIDAFIGIGSNLEQPAEQVRRALAALHQPPMLCSIASSSLYETDPVGYLNQPKFINAVARVSTRLSPHDLLDRLREIEAHHGRQRDIPDGPRTLDLDLLLFGDRIIRDNRLSVPHPRMHTRAFVLMPLVEVAPDAWLPGIGRADECLAAISTQGVVRLKP